MPENLKYQPVRHDHAAFVAQAREREGFSEAYDALHRNTSSPAS